VSRKRGRLKGRRKSWSGLRTAATASSREGQETDKVCRDSIGGEETGEERGGERERRDPRFWAYPAKVDGRF